MHFAYAPRKTSNPPPYAARSPKSQYLRRSRLQLLGLVAAGALFSIWLLSTLFRSSSARKIPAGTPPVVLVTTIDRRASPASIANILDNRKDYAFRHGYATFFANTSDYDLGVPPAPDSWSKVPALRHAMTLYPHSAFFFYLSQNALIMNPSLSLERHVLGPARLESLMIVDKPVVPPDSVIKTFSHLKGDRINLVITQDGEGLSQESFILRRGNWAKYFLDSWFDPLYRSYNFQKAEGHALEHLVQWHGTVLAKLALIPQRTINSYSRDSSNNKDGTYHEGDFVANFHGCDRDGNRNCEKEMAPLMTRWREIRDSGTRRV
ncbi:hypothetical protein B0A49_05552 [Cryomyces minteri]|uniref:Uncharacterized protein n=1 Tax=Cryomyces minteri TaxID=331657 RepID=A0A4U0X4D5_9PEZI|nr:hypothetical protein B0A49_05552 [Cryomyces minteri]